MQMQVSSCPRSHSCPSPAEFVCAPPTKVWSSLNNNIHPLGSAHCLLHLYDMHVSMFAKGLYPSNDTKSGHAQG